MTAPAPPVTRIAGLPPLYRFEDVAEHCGITLRALKVHAKQVQHIHFGVNYFFTEDQLKAFLKSRTESGEGPSDDRLGEARARRDRRSRVPRQRKSAA